MISEHQYMPGTELRAPHACLMQYRGPWEAGVITFISNVQMRKVRLEGPKTLVQGHTAKDIMGLLTQASLMPTAPHP